MANLSLMNKILGEKAQEFEKKLKFFSVSEQDAQFRRKAFADTLEQTLDINSMYLNGGNRGRKTFAGGASLTAANVAGVSIYSGIMRSYVNNIAPIFSVQRSIDAPEQKIMYVDFYDVLNDQLIVPNIGPDKAWADIKNHTTDTINPANDYTITSGTPIIPKSFRAEIYNNTTLVGTLEDNGQQGFLATPGLITNDSKITYNTGGSATVLIKWATGLTANKIVYSCLYDVTAKDEINRAFGRVKYWDMVTTPLLVPVERNIIADHAMQKQGIINSDELYANFIENEYTKAINQRCFDALIGGYRGDTYKLDLSSFSLAAGFYDTIVRSFKSLLTQAENVLAEQTYKSAKCTGYLADPMAVNMFDLMSPGDGWVKNIESTYYKDIVGWFNDVPVVRCVDLGEGEIMLTHRTSDGYVAPLYHGMFLAPTEMPVVANYANMTKYAAGMYSMEGFGFSSSKLCVKVKVIPPKDLTLVKL